MAKLSFLSKGFIASQDAQKIYFSAHIDDITLYLENLSEKIIKFDNCVVYYNDVENDVFTEEDEIQLLKMHAFIVPVTSRLLSEKNRALDKEIPFAIKHHIPLLFIMMEKGLEELFNAKCGNYHLISAVDDPLYDTKRDKFLESVLTNNTLLQQIHDAFNPFIFISYRKKDKACIQPLMKIIHQDDVHRDVGVWYDEFLLPGEDFNKSIEDALKKSALFALAITPNLIEDDNYVLTTEYPLACAENKIILPIELVKTNLEDVKNKFKGITKIYKSDDHEYFCTAIKNALRDIPRQERTPEHDYLIGLAYLKGIDTESDKEKAINILTSASDRGSLAAKRTLMNVYWYGDGVELDIFKAYDFGTDLIDEYQKRIDTSHRLEDYLAYASIVEDMDMLMYLGIYLQFHDCYDGSLHTKLFTQAFNIFEDGLIHHPKDLRAPLAKLYTLPSIHFWYLDELDFTQEQLIEASKKSATIYEDLILENPKYKQMLADVYYNLYELVYVKDPEYTYTITKRAQELYDELANENYEHFKNIANNRINLIKSLNSLGYNDEAEKYAEETICFLENVIYTKLTSKINEDIKTELLTNHLPYVYYMLSSSYQANNKVEKQLGILTTGLDKYLALEKIDPKNYQSNVINFYNDLADAYSENNDSTLAEYYYEKALISAHKLYETDKQNGKESLLNTLQGLKDHYEFLDNFEKVNKLYAEIITLIQTDLTDTSQGESKKLNIERIFYFYYSRVNYYVTKLKASNLIDPTMIDQSLTTEAINAINDGLKFIHNPTIDLKDYKMLNYREASLFKEASFVYKVVKNNDVRIAVDLRQCELLIKALDNDDLDKHDIKLIYADFIENQIDLGEAYCNINDYKTAEPVYKEALELLETLGNEIEKSLYLKHDVFNKLKTLYQKLGKNEEAIYYNKKALDIAKQLKNYRSPVLKEAEALMKEFGSSLLFDI